MNTQEVHDLVGALSTREPAPPPVGLRVETLVRRGDRAILTGQTYQQDYRLPGAAVREGESVIEVAQRALREETGLTRKVSRVLAVDQSAGVTLVFDGGMLMADEADSCALPPEGMDQLVDLGWIPAERMHHYTADGHTDRVAEALLALRAGNRLPMLLHGKHSSG